VYSIVEEGHAVAADFGDASAFGGCAKMRLNAIMVNTRLMANRKRWLRSLWTLLTRVDMAGSPS
jgi:hypothetical protein